MINQLALFYLQKTAKKRGSKLRFKRLFLAWSIHYTSENKHKNSAIIRQRHSRLKKCRMHIKAIFSAVQISRVFSFLVRKLERQGARVLELVAHRQ